MTDNRIVGDVSGCAVQIGQVTGDFHLHHHIGARQPTTVEASRWTPDPHFTGRTQVLENLRTLLRLGEPGDVAPVVLYGMTGCGKTSVATQLGTDVPGSVTPIFVDASSRTSLLEELQRLAGKPQRNGVIAAAGPVTPGLPVSPDTLLIIDGVTSTETLRGIVPRSTRCRVLITSTVRYLDHGYIHVELADWTPEESSEYLVAVMPNSTEDEHARLASALHHHPLALTQAAHHCRVLERPVDMFLKRFTEEPAGTLGLGEASGHERTTIRSIEMNIDLATRQEAGALDLLQVLAHLGSEPLAVSYLESVTTLAYVRSCGPFRLRGVERLHKLLRRPLWLSRLLGEHSRATWSTVALLSDPLTLDRAITSLAQLSLIKVSGDGYLVHPLVALVARARTADPLPWLQIGFGLFAERVGEVHTEVGDAEDIDLCLSHLVELTTTAISHGHRGTAVVETCLHLARRLAHLGGSGESANASWFAKHVISVIADDDRLRRTSPEFEARARLALTLIAFRDGRASEAFEQCEQALLISAAVGTVFHYVSALRSLGEMASVVGDHDLSRQVLQVIADERQKPHTIDMHVSLASTSAQILLSLNEIEEAQACSAWACEQLANHELPTAIHQSALLVAATVARMMDNPETRLHHETTLLDVRRAAQANGRRTDIWFLESLHSTADAAIDANELGLAQELVEEAVVVAENMFGEQSDHYANVLSVRGRLRLHQRRFPAALRDLTYCADFFRAQPAPVNGPLPAVLVHLALVHAATGARGRAIAAATEAYDIDVALYGADHPETLKDLDVLAIVKGRRPQPPRASS